MEIRRGEIYWVTPDPAREPVPDYNHPHVVVQDDVFNLSRLTTIVFCALTTNLQRMNEAGNVLLEPGEGGLPKQSVVVVSRIDAVDRARFGARIGVVGVGRVDEILQGLRFQQASFTR